MFFPSGDTSTVYQPLVVAKRATSGANQLHDFYPMAMNHAAEADDILSGFHAIPPLIDVNVVPDTPNIRNITVANFCF